MDLEAAIRAESRALADEIVAAPQEQRLVLLEKARAELGKTGDDFHPDDADRIRSAFSKTPNLAVNNALLVTPPPRASVLRPATEAERSLAARATQEALAVRPQTTARLLRPRLQYPPPGDPNSGSQVGGMTVTPSTARKAETLPGPPSMARSAAEVLIWVGVLVGVIVTLLFPVAIPIALFWGAVAVWQGWVEGVEFLQAVSGRAASSVWWWLQDYALLAAIVSAGYAALAWTGGHKRHWAKWASPILCGASLYGAYLCLEWRADVGRIERIARADPLKVFAEGHSPRGLVTRTETFIDGPVRLVRWPDLEPDVCGLVRVGWFGRRVEGHFYIAQAQDCARHVRRMQSEPLRLSLPERRAEALQLR